MPFDKPVGAEERRSGSGGSQKRDFSRLPAAEAELLAPAEQTGEEEGEGECTLRGINDSKDDRVSDHKQSDEHELVSAMNIDKNR